MPNLKERSEELIQIFATAAKLEGKSPMDLMGWRAKLYVWYKLEYKVSLGLKVAAWFWRGVRPSIRPLIEYVAVLVLGAILQHFTGFIPK